MTLNMFYVSDCFFFFVFLSFQHLRMFLFFLIISIRNVKLNDIMKKKSITKTIAVGFAVFRACKYLIILNGLISLPKDMM